MRKMISLFLSLFLICNLSIPTFADIIAAGGSDEVPVELTQAASNFSVTVPTVLPVDVAADGTVTVSTNNKIINNSFGPVEVKSVNVQPQNEWSIIDFNSNFKSLKVGSHQFGFELNGSNVETDGSCSATFPIINGKSEIIFNYNAKVAPQNIATTRESIANVVFTIGWYADSVVTPISKPLFTMVHRPTNTTSIVTSNFNINLKDITYYNDEMIDIINNLGYSFSLYNSNEYYAKFDTSKLIEEDFISIGYGETGVISMSRDFLGKTLGELGEYSVIVDWPAGNDLSKTKLDFSIKSDSGVNIPTVCYTWYYADGTINEQDDFIRTIWIYDANTKTFIFGDTDTILTENMTLYIDGDNILWDIAINN